jgi:hypothetical protein
MESGKENLKMEKSSLMWLILGSDGDGVDA